MLKVTDHALVQYLERIMEMNLDPIREEMQPNEKILQALETLGTTDPVKYTKHGMKLVVKDDRVVTCYEE